MSTEHMTIHAEPKLASARMVLGFSGWMNGGDVSTGTVEHLTEALGAELLAEIDSEHFYIYSFPGSMEVSALFRPHTRIEDGLITEWDPPTSRFYCSEDADLIIFRGREPNLHWHDFADNVFAVAAACNVETVYFIGTVSGLVPHSREPRLFSSVSDASLKPALEPLGVRFSDYEGPASIVTYLTRQATQRGVGMVSLVAEIPAYVQGRNPKCIASVIRRLCAILGLQPDLDALRAESEDFERKLDEIVDEKHELGDLIGKLEADYDNEVFDTQMGDLKDWLEQKGIRLD